MEAIEAVAIIILIIAILILIYYYLLNSPETAQKLRNIVPRTADAHLNEVLSSNSGYDGLTKESSGGSGSGSMSKRIKVKLNDIDMSSLNTDAFSNKIDAFLDDKSDQLIKEWALATTSDLKDLESKFSETAGHVDTLEKSFDEFKKSSEEFQKVTEEKLEDLDKRIESLENK